MSARLLSLAALTMTVALLSACGSSSSSSSSSTTTTEHKAPSQTATFKHGYEPVVQQFGAISMDTGHAIQQAPKQTNNQILAQFRALANRWERQLSRLETLKPPAALAADTTTLESAAKRVEADFRAIVPAAATNDAAAAKRASAKLVSDILDAKTAAMTVDKTLSSQ